jgi:WhiB family redox-sensing transcriptional regulator
VSSWRDRALCRGVESTWFFDEVHALEQSVARRVCAQCPVAGDCLADALAREEHGVWAGLDAAERQRLSDG